jgi:hypothetical protein
VRRQVVNNKTAYLDFLRHCHCLSLLVVAQDDNIIIDMYDIGPRDTGMNREACAGNVGVALLFECRGPGIQNVHRCLPLLKLMRVREELDAETPDHHYL